MKHILRFTLLLGLAILQFAASRTVRADENPIYAELVDKGVVIGDGPGIKVPQPTMPDGLDAAGQRKALESVTTVTEVKRSVDDLLRKSFVSPFVLKITDDKTTGANSTVRHVDLWFVAYGTLDAVKSEGFWKATLERETPAKEQDGPESKAVTLTDEELAERKITPTVVGSNKERFGSGLFTLFDRVRINGTMRSLQTEGTESVFAASVLDPRFVTDPKYPNQWRPLTRDDAGKTSEGSPLPYSGAGSYAKATKLIEPAGALFVEFHLVFDEPAGWFNGANLLRSKLPLLAQDGVRKFRRKLVAQAK